MLGVERLLIQYVGNGTLSEYDIPFRLFEETDVVVYRDNEILTLGADFNVVGIGSISQKVSLIAGNLADNAKLRIYRAIPADQVLSISNRGEMFPSDVETALDRGVAIVQDNFGVTLDASVTSIAGLRAHLKRDISASVLSEIIANSTPGDFEIIGNGRAKIIFDGPTDGFSMGGLRNVKIRGVNLYFGTGWADREPNQIVGIAIDGCKRVVLDDIGYYSANIGTALGADGVAYPKILTAVGISRANSDGQIFVGNIFREVLG